MRPGVTAQFDPATNTVSYIVVDPGTRQCAVVDSVLDFDYASGRTSTESADRIISAVREAGHEVEWVLETHVHADHLSAAPYVQECLGGKIGIGEQIVEVQEAFGKIFNEGTRFQRDGSQFDRLFRQGDRFRLGGIECAVLETPGHTPACITYVIGDAAFVGDTMFMPDFGSARADFPGGSAGTLYDSIQKILALPGNTRIFVGHDYKPPGREDFAWRRRSRSNRRTMCISGRGRRGRTSCGFAPSATANWECRG